MNSPRQKLGLPLFALASALVIGALLAFGIFRLFQQAGDTHVAELNRRPGVAVQLASVASFNSLVDLQSDDVYVATIEGQRLEVEICRKLATLDRPLFVQCIDSELSPEAFAELDDHNMLVGLELRGCRNVSDSLVALAHTRDLREVQLSGTFPDSDSGESPLSFLRNQLSLRVLNFADIAVTDEVIGFIKHCSKVEAIELPGTKVTGEKLSECEWLNNVRALNFRGCQLDKKAFQAIGVCHNLETLDISYSGAGDDDVKQLEGLQRLSVVYAEGLPLSTAGIGVFQSLPSLDLIGLKATKVSEEQKKILEQKATVRF